MREGPSENQVTSAYGALYLCVVSQDELLHRCVGLLGPVQYSPPRPLVVSKDALEEVVDAVRQIRKFTEQVERQLGPKARDLPVIAEEPVRSGPFTGASWAEVVLEHAHHFVKRLSEWEYVKADDDDELRRLIDTVTTCMPNVRELKANLQIESAKHHERAEAQSPEVRYAYELNELKGHSRKLFKFFVANPGRDIGYEELAEFLYGDRTASNGRIQTAVYRLRTKLDSFGSTEVASRVESEEGGYRFRE